MAILNKFQMLNAPQKRGVKGIKEIMKIKRYGDVDNEANVTDILTDLRHFCDVEGIVFGDQDKKAHQHYLEERRA